MFSRLLITLILAVSQAHAAQTVVVENNGTASAKISSDEANRLVIDGGRIAEVFGAQGTITAEPDKATGELFIRPTAAYAKKPFTLHIKSNDGEIYSLLFMPMDIPAETITIRSRNKDEGKIKPNYAKALEWEKLHSYENTLIQLMTHMANRQTPDGYGHQFLNQEIKLWKEAKVSLTKRYRGATLIGEHYKLMNISKDEMRLDEKEFYRVGVVAVSIEPHVLKQRESADVYIISVRENALNGDTNE
jgi:conjugal transfer pilus assembly protein TraK